MNLPPRSSSWYDSSKTSAERIIRWAESRTSLKMEGMLPMILLVGFNKSDAIMKTLTKSLMLAAVAATALISCAKEIESPVEINKVKSHVEFSAQVVGETGATKATLTTTDDKDFTASWVDGTDIIGLYALDGDSFDETAPATWNATKETFEADFVTSAPTVAGDWMYEATYPYDADGNIPFGSPRVQNGNAYNSAYDIMYGAVDYTNALLGKDDTGANFVIPMNRLTGIAYFHITSSIDEDVVSATLEATGIAAENVTIASNGASVAASTGSASLDAITITFADGTAPKATDLKLWFNVLPGSYSGLKLTINTTTKTAVLNSKKTMTYTAGKLNKAVLSSLTWETPTEGAAYTWNLASGDLGSTGSPSASVTKGSPSLTWDADYTWGDASSATKFFGWNDSKGVQVGAGSATNKCTSLVLTTSGYTDYISKVRVNFSHASSGGSSVAIKVGDVSLKNGDDTSVSGSTDATNYVFESATLVKGDVEITFSNSAAKAFYIKSIEINPDTRTPQTLSFPQSAYSTELTDGTYTSPALSGAQTSVTYDSSDKTVAEVDNTGLVTLKAIGSTVITATAAENDTYQEGTASYTLTVTAGPQSIASVISADSGASVYTQGIVAQVNLKGFIITDGTDNLAVYQNANPTVVVGQSVKVTGTRGAYNNVPQISSPTITPGTTGQTVTRTTLSTISSSNATGFTSSQYVSLTGTLTVNGTYYNVSIAGSTVQGSIYQTSATQSFTGGTITEMDGKVVVVTGYVTGSAAKYLYIAPVDIEIDPTVATLVTDPVDGTTIEWDDDKFGTSNEETITVYLNSAASGYSVDFTDTNNEWNVSDDTNGSITVSPKAANISSTTDKELEITITHDDETTLTSVITLKQKRVGGKTYTITWNATNNSASVNNYTSTWSVTADGLTLTMANWNNNQNGWNYVKCGRKANNSGTEFPSVATIIGTVPEAIKTVKITIDAINATYVNSATLYIASDDTFTSPQTVSIPLSTGEKTLSVPTPTASQYYKIEFDCKSMPKSGSNGFVQISQLVFTTD